MTKPTEESTPVTPKVLPKNDYCLASAALVYVGDVPFTCTSIPAAAQWLVTQPKPGYPIRLANAYSVAFAHRDAAYRMLLDSRGINLPDGTPVDWVMRFRGRGASLQSQRVRGPSLFNETLKASEGTPARHFLLGGTPETMSALMRRIDVHYPAATIVGTLAPPFGPLDEPTLVTWVDAIMASGANIVWVSLGTPKQDFAAAYLSDQTGLNCLGVGAAFDFLAGTQREAPQWVQRLALEWLFRLVTEPRRLWRRYLIGNLQFMAAVLRAPRVIDLRDRPGKTA